MKKVSIQSIAQKTSLSRNTVSKALRSDDSVAMETRQRVIEAAREMGYQKLVLNAPQDSDNPAKITNGKTVGVLISRSLSEFWERILIGIADEMNRSRGSCIVNFINETDEKALLLPANVQKGKMDGIICLSSFENGFMGKIQKVGIPVVFLDLPLLSENDQLPGDAIILEGERSTFQITSDLIKRGYRRLGFLGDCTYCQTIYDRWRGFEMAVRLAGLPLEPDFCLTSHAENRYYKEVEVESRLAGLKELPEALVCANDVIAVFAWQYLESKGYRIPQDIAITGFDDSVAGKKLDPPLTSVRIANYRLGCRLVQEMFWRLQNPSMPFEVIKIDTEVICRDTSTR